MKKVTVETFGVDYPEPEKFKFLQHISPADAPARIRQIRGVPVSTGVLICGKRAVAPGHHKTGTLKLKDNSTELVAA